MRYRRPYRTEIRDIEIYAIIFPESQQVFIGKNWAPNHYQSYKDHVGERKKHTKALFKIAKQTGNFPKMYLLNRLETTEIRAYHYIIAWTRFFTDKGFQVLTHTRTSDYATDLLDETQGIFDSIKGFSLEEITGEERILVGSYTPRAEKTDDVPTQITINLSPEEYRHIKAKADAEHMSLSKYCRLMAVDGTVTRISFSEYADEIRAYKRVMREVQLGIYQSGKYFPADLENMQKLVKQINANQKRVIKTFEREFTKLQKLKLGK